MGELRGEDFLGNFGSDHGPFGRITADFEG